MPGCHGWPLLSWSTDIVIVNRYFPIEIHSMSNPFKASWTAKGHTLCLGHWEITYKERLLTLPEQFYDSDLGTWGVYDPIYDDDPEFSEGLAEDEWVIDNVEWLLDMFIAADVPADQQHMAWFYQAVNPQDWRCGSCGGCI